MAFDAHAASARRRREHLKNGDKIIETTALQTDVAQASPRTILLWATVAAVAAACLALMVALGRDAGFHHAAFELAHPNFFGFPAVLAFVVLAVGARAWARSPDSQIAASTTVVGLLWASATLLFPHTWLGVLRLPIGLALDGLSGSDRLSAVVVTLSALPVLAGWLTVISKALRRASGLKELAVSARPLVIYAPWMFVAHHLVAPLFARNLAGLWGSVFVAALIATVTLLGAKAIAAAEQLSSDALRDRSALVLDILVPTVVLVLFGLLKIHSMGASNTDDNIYFYMAADLARGRWPYVDYFFAHPPLHVLVPGVFFTVFGYSLTLGKMFAAVSSAVTGLAVWAAGRHAFGRISAAVAMIAFLFAYETLVASSTMTGVNLTTMWLILGLWQFLKGRGMSAGVLFGLAASTGFYSIAAICAGLALAAFRDRRFFLRLLGGFLLVWGGLNLVFIIAAGDAFIDGVYRYHGLKAFQDKAMVPLFGGDKTFVSALLHNIKVMVAGRPFTEQIYYQSHLWMSFLLAPALGLFAWLSSSEGRKSPVRFFDPRRFWQAGPHASAALVFLVAVSLFIQYSLFRELYSFYFVLIYPLLSLLLGYVVVQAGTFVRDAVVGFSIPKLSAGVVALVVFSLWVPWTRNAGAIFPDEAKQLGKRNTYVWQPAPVLPSLSEPARRLFWADYRLKGNDEPGYRSYLWTKKRHFVSLNEIADFVRETTTPNETIAGASALAPIIALTAGRRLAADEVDTNYKRFSTGLLSEADYWDAICKDGVRYIVSVNRSYFTQKKMTQSATGQRWFREVKTFYDPQLAYGGRFPITLYERVGECRWEGPR